MRKKRIIQNFLKLVDNWTLDRGDPQTLRCNAHTPLVSELRILLSF